MRVTAHPPAAALVCVACVWPGTKETRLIARRGGDRLGPGAATIARGSIDSLAAVARRPSSPAPLQVIVVNVVVVIFVGIGRRGGEGDIVAGIGQGGKETSTQPPAVARGGGGAGGLGAQDDSGGEELIVGAFGIHVGEAPPPWRVVQAAIVRGCLLVCRPLTPLSLLFFTSTS